jgi:hypothetical protein
MFRGEFMTTIVDGTHPKYRVEGEPTNDEAPKVKGFMASTKRDGSTVPAHIFWQDDEFWLVESIDSLKWGKLFDDGHLNNLGLAEVPINVNLSIECAQDHEQNDKGFQLTDFDDSSLHYFKEDVEDVINVLSPTKRPKWPKWYEPYVSADTFEIQVAGVSSKFVIMKRIQSLRNMAFLHGS